MELGTFSIVARCVTTGDFGVATATAVPCVGSLVPFAQEGVGAVATQAWTNVNLGYQGLLLMSMGLTVRQAMEAILATDERRSHRQVVAIDAESSFGYTGDDCSDAKGHILGDDFAVSGNLLTSLDVLTAMAESFKASRGDLSSRLLAGLEAGQAAGGDSRGKTSSALLVASSKPALFHNIRIDKHEEPVRELRRVYEECVRIQAEYGEEELLWELRRRGLSVQKRPMKCKGRS